MVIGGTWNIKFDPVDKAFKLTTRGQSENFEIEINLDKNVISTMINALAFTAHHIFDDNRYVVDQITKYPSNIEHISRINTVSVATSLGTELVMAFKVGDAPVYVRLSRDTATALAKLLERGASVNDFGTA